MDRTLWSQRLASAPLGEVDAVLAVAEQACGPIRPGAAKGIVWHDPRLRRPTDLCLVYLHGFSASRGEIAPVCDRMAHRLGANLFYTRLAGHGRDGVALAAATTADWLYDAREAVALGRRLGRRVVIFGTSTGGTLAVWAAAQAELAPHVSALVLMSPNFGPHHPLAGPLQYPCLQPAVVRLIRSWRRFPAVNAGHAAVWTLDYPWTAVLPMLNLVRTVGRIDPRRIRIPVLLFYHAGDRVVRVGRMRRFYRCLGSRSRRRFRIDRSAHPGRHILAGDIFAPAMTRPVADLAAAFIQAA
jgi:alpha-beta hydrolase superfamily lysophospholipase